jgi:hypothetical protein
VLVTGREDGLLHPELTQPVAQSCERCTNGVFCANHEAQS